MDDLTDYKLFKIFTRLVRCVWEFYIRV